MTKNVSATVAVLLGLLVRHCRAATAAPVAGAGAFGHALADRIQPPDRSRSRAPQAAGVCRRLARCSRAPILRVRVDRDDRARTCSRDRRRAARRRQPRQPALGRDAHRSDAGRPAAAAHRRRHASTRRSFPVRARSRWRSSGARRSTFTPGRAVVRAAGAAGRHRARHDRSARRSGGRPAVGRV